jgi:hypothetical protein
MNTFINIFFIFIFIFAILLFRVPNIDNNNYIVHKVIIFALLFGYQFILLVASKIKNKCKIEFMELLTRSLETATIGIVGYSLYTDLQFYRFTGIDSLYIINKNTQYLYVSIIITLLLTFVNTVKLLFGYTPYECIKYK